MSIMNSISDKRILAYVAIAITCIVIIAVAVYFQFFYVKEKPRSWTPIENSTVLEEEEVEKIKTGFNYTFNNSVRKNKRRHDRCSKVGRY